jgi:hypothetical protein
LEPWLDDDKKKLREKWATKARKWRRFSYTWRITSNSSPSTLSNTLSMGGIWRMKGKGHVDTRITFTTRCSSFFFRAKHNA